MDWIRNLVSANKPGGWGVHALLLSGMLLVFAAMAPRPVDLLSSNWQVADPYKGLRFKIEIPLFNGLKTAQNSILPGHADREFPVFGHEAASSHLAQSGSVFLHTGDGDVDTVGGSQLAGSREKNDRAAAQKGKASFYPIINRAAEQYQIDPHLVRAIIFAESGYNPRAVSKKGAMGLMQLMPGTAKAMGVEDCFNPEHNIFGGVKYFKKLFTQFDGNITLALAAYNAGSRKVREFNGVPPFKATEHYIQKVLKYYKIYKNQQAGQVELS